MLKILTLKKIKKIFNWFQRVKFFKKKFKILQNLFNRIRIKKNIILKELNFILN
jgi:hypothetical protein